MVLNLLPLKAIQIKYKTRMKQGWTFTILIYFKAIYSLPPVTAINRGRNITLTLNGHSSTVSDKKYREIITDYSKTPIKLSSDET